MRLFYVIIYALIYLVSPDVCAAHEDPQNYYRTFWSPTYEGQQLNYCDLSGKECGNAVANEYCKRMGYQQLDQQVIAWNIGLTHFLGTRARCKGWECNGFMLIRCKSRMSHTPPKEFYYRQKKFVYPYWEHYRVDWCYTQNHQCGQKAARSFCRRMGFSKAIHFSIDSHAVATKTIGNHALCFGNKCQGYKYITCFR